MTAYLWFKAFHVISVIAWMAGMLYLPRLFVYHCDAARGSVLAETFEIMERRLLRGIMNPAMIGTYFFGITLVVYNPAWLDDYWLYVKIALVLTLTAAHMAMARWRRDFVLNRNKRSQAFYRVINEVPALLMVGIVILVIVKPF